MPTPTINRQDAIDLFNWFMQPDSPCRVLRLSGEGKMGKTHLMAKVFPELAREIHQARCAVLDLRNRAQTIPDILHVAYGLLGDQSKFPNYYATYQEGLAHRPQVEVKGLKAVLASVVIRGEEAGDESRKWTRHLTAQFAADLRELTDSRVALLFDALDVADESTQAWLMDTLAVQLARFAHLRLVVAGRRVPEPAATYAAVCASYDLPPVQEEEEYIIKVAEIIK